MKIGFIGLGTMGSPMCKNLLTHHFQLGVYNKTEDKAQPLVEKGAISLKSQEALSNWADAVIIMVSDDTAVEGIVEKIASAGKIIINMSTISVELTRQLAKKAQNEEFEFINAPVSGSKKPAEDGQLIILYGGKVELLPRLEKVFRAMGKEIINAGSQENSAKLKLIVNFMMAGMLESLAESMVLMKKMGLDQEILLKTVELGAMNCPMVRMKGPSMMQGNFEPAFSTKFILKDLRYLEKEAEKIQHPIQSNVIELYAHSNKTFQDKDLSAIYRMLELGK
jgi:3-hydroxyisobutyrate dehydrogenase-like beta-hydroxyacid dehydrogenase